MIESYFLEAIKHHSKHLSSLFLILTQAFLLINICGNLIYDLPRMDLNFWVAIVNLRNFSNTHPDPVFVPVNDTLKASITDLTNSLILLVDTIFNFYYSSDTVFLLDSINTMILFPLIVNFINIKENKFSKVSIKKYMKDSSIVLFLILLFYELLAFYK